MEVNIKSLDDFGRGITKDEGKTIFINNALPGEVVDIKITKSKKNFDEAVVNNIVKASNSRR